MTHGLCREHAGMSPEKLVAKILEEGIEYARMLVENCPRKKVKGTFYTVEEIVIGVLYYRLGMSPNQIAEKLGMSRSNVYAFLRKLRDTAARAQNTIRTFNYLSSYISVRAVRGERLRDVIKRIYEEANKLKIRVPYGSLDLAEEIRKHGVVDEDNRFSEDVTIEIDLMTNKIIIKKK